MQKRWVISQAPEEKVLALQSELKIHRALCQILVQRGIKNYDQAKAFFRPSLKELHNPFQMKDMDRAIRRITTAMKQGEKILIYGDYDVDGTTAVAAVYSFFKQLYPNIDYYVPHRYTEGYGISIKGIDYAAEHGFSLVIALDCGIKANEQMEYAKSKNIDFIIGDHHLPGTDLPDAYAVLDPKRSDCSYPFKELSGCGIGFKLIQAFAQENQIPETQYLQYLDLVCVSIGADIVPVTGENRVLAWHGLKKLNTNPSPGIKHLIEVAGKKKPLTITDVVFLLGPRINAAGRMDDARQAVKLLIADEEDSDVLSKAFQLNDFNNERKDLDRSITAHALAMIGGDESLIQRKSTVVYHPEWHKGVIGIVASRLTETYYRPTIVLTESEGKVTGSARSVKDFDLYEALYDCRDLLLQFGGHKFAAGLSLKPENVPLFSERFEEAVSSRITADQLTPEISVDAEISLEDIQPKFFNLVKQMAPFGPGNMDPVFMSRGVKESGWSNVVKEDHLRFSFRKPNNEWLSGIGFNMADKINIVKSGAFDITYHIQENEWQEQVQLQIMVKDVRQTANP